MILGQAGYPLSNGVQQHSPRHHIRALTGFQLMRLSSRVEGMIRNYQRIIDGCLADALQKELASWARPPSASAKSAPATSTKLESSSASPTAFRPEWFTAVCNLPKNRQPSPSMSIAQRSIEKGIW